MTNYIRHKIYCDLDYKSLTSIAAEYFVSRRYYDYASEKIFKNEKKIYNYKDTTHFTVVYAKSLIDLSGSVSVSSKNLKGKYSRRELQMTDFPLSVQQRFKNIPNVLIIDLHKNYYKAQVNIVVEIANKLKSLGYTVYDNSFNGQLLTIFDSIDNNEGKLTAIHDLIYNYFDTSKLPTIDLSEYHSDFALLIPNLHPDSIRALKTAEMLYSMEVELPDYSPIIIEYCKLIEIEINDKILQPLKSHFNGYSSTSLITSSSLNKLKSFVLSKNNKSLELGTFAFIVEKITYENINDMLAKKISEIIEELPFKLQLRNIVEDIFYLTRNYRNKAAHKSILSIKDMTDCRHFTLGDKNNLGFLSKLVNIG